MEIREHIAYIKYFKEKTITEQERALENFKILLQTLLKINKSFSRYN